MSSYTEGIDELVQYVSRLNRREDLQFTEERKQIRRAAADVCDLEFAKIYFPHVFNEPWNDIHRHIAGLTEGKYTISGARRFGKSAFTYIAKVIKPIVLGKAGIINISLRTQYSAKERTASIFRLITGNRLLCYDYNVEATQNTKGYHIINGVHLVATSVQMGLRAILNDNFKRFSVSVNDDLYNITTVYSETDNQKVYEFITSEVYGQLEPDALCITLGNSITENCPIRMLAETQPDNHFSLPATNEQGNTNWPGHSVFTNEYWKTKKEELPVNVWLGEYMDNPVTKGEVFNTDWLNMADLSQYKIETFITIVDPGYGASPSACKKGVVTLGITTCKRFVVYDVWLRTEEYTNLFDYVFELAGRLPNWKCLLFENDFSQWEIAKPYYIKWKDDTGKLLPIMMFTAKDLKTEYSASDKESRILNLVYPHQNSMIMYNHELTNTADFKEYKTQYLGFGSGKSKVDGLDALASAYILIQRYTQNQSFKSLKKRAFNGRENNWLNRF